MKVTLQLLEYQHHVNAIHFASILTGGRETGIINADELESKPEDDSFLMKKTFSLLFDLLLIALIALGIAFRFNWTNWSEGADLHPDEYGLTGTITSLSIPKSIQDYFNTRISPISPYQKYDLAGNPTENGPDNRMRWGQWPIILIRAAAEATGNTGYSELRLMGRNLSALADTLSLLVLFFLGRRLYSPRAGALAAALGALAVMQIQQSHFMTSDTFGVLFTILAVYSAVRTLPSDPANTAGRSSTWLWYALFGVFLGMAVASRVNLAVLAGVIVLAALIDIYQSTNGFKTGWRAPILRAGLQLALAAAFTLLVFRVTQPMTFRAATGDTTFLTLHLNQDWVESMKVAQNESNGVNAGPPGEQWTNRPILVFPFVNMVVWGMGLPLGLAAWAGFGWAGWRVLRMRSGWQAHLLPLAWTGVYFLFMGTRHVMSMRYFLPVYPFLCLFAAWGLLELYPVFSRTGENPPRGFSFRPALSVLLTGVVIAGTLAWAGSFVEAVYAQGNTRIRATRWILENIPAPFLLHLQSGQKLTSLPLSAPDALPVTPGEAYSVPFSPTSDASLTGIDIAHLRSLSPEIPADQIVLSISQDSSGQNPLARIPVAVPKLKTDMRGEPASAHFSPILLTAGQTYYLIVSSEQSAAVVQRSVTANESWDESLPVRLDGYDPFGQFYSGQTMEVRWPDDENKRQMFITTLSQTDYIIVPSQRSMWSISRLPGTYPMTMEYYRALFDGRLGFDLIAQFQAPMKIGPLYISDLAGAAAFGAPPALPLFNNRLLASEEAFSVYDHAPVWVFKKRADFSLGSAVKVLAAVDLSQEQSR
jgi:hypothetical protein